ncbi:MAG: radical SAM protein [Planctomycetota bacterium]|jgi:MoaA/NifB/PqqE/SkfB family radical SAM enzyme
MALTGIHFLLTYTCNYACDHCFLFSSPDSHGTFTIKQIRQILDEAQALETVESIYFEGGEPTLYYPVMLEGIKCAREKGFKAGIVTNAYWAITEEDAEIWLKPIAGLGISDLSVSNDAYHSSNPEDCPATRAVVAANKLGIPVGSICIEKPVIDPSRADEKGKPAVGGGTVFRGRAVDKLADNLPVKPAGEFTECLDEDLENQGRVHVDSFGNVHVCQGIIIGNAWKKPFSQIMNEYRPTTHPICGSLLEGGPALLAKKHGLDLKKGYISACHLCYTTRLALIEKYPEYLAPRQVYGLKDS